MPIGAVAAPSDQPGSRFPASCDPQELREAIRNGLDVNRLNESGLSPIFDAAMCDSGVNGPQMAMVREMLAGGFNVALTDTSGMGVLETLLMNGSEASFRILLEAGANPNQTTTELGVSLLALARMYGNDGAVRALEDYGAELTGSALEDKALAIFPEDTGGYMRELRYWIRMHPQATDAERNATVRGMMLRHFGEEAEEWLDALEPPGPGDSCCVSNKVLENLAPRAISNCERRCSSANTMCWMRCSRIPYMPLRLTCAAGCTVGYAICRSRCNQEPEDDPVSRVNDEDSTLTNPNDPTP